jgi:hypothetical protein
MNACSCGDDGGHPNILLCAKHGEQRWVGHMICVFCEKVYHTHDLPNPAEVDSDPIACSCGKKLSSTNFRPICGACAKDAGVQERGVC